jgi:uncharacterized coiled-coil DUF342 family protein
MAKSLEEKREERLKEITELTKQREAINAKLNFLTGVTDGINTKSTETPIPEGFSITKEVETLFQEHPQLRILQATALLKKKFPQYQIERRKVHSSLVYLAERGKAKKEEERGLFSWKNNG